VSRLNVIGFPRNGSVSAAYEKAPGGQHAAKRVDSVVAGWLLPVIGILIGGGILGSIINAFIGACIVLFVVRLINCAYN
jgi:hypothetical protein